MDFLKLRKKLVGKKAVFLDLDNTLYRYAPCHQSGLKAAHTAYSRIETISFSAFLADYQKARAIVHHRLKGQAASHSRLLYFQALVEARTRQSDFSVCLRLEKKYWDAFLSRMRLNPWVHSFWKECAHRRLLVLLVTNLTSQIQMRKILKLGIGKQIALRRHEALQKLYRYYYQTFPQHEGWS